MQIDCYQHHKLHCVCSKICVRHLILISTSNHCFSVNETIAHNCVRQILQYTFHFVLHFHFDLSLSKTLRVVFITIRNKFELLSEIDTVLWKSRTGWSKFHWPRTESVYITTCNKNSTNFKVLTTEKKRKGIKFENSKWYLKSLENESTEMRVSRESFKKNTVPNV